MDKETNYGSEIELVSFEKKHKIDLMIKEEINDIKFDLKQYFENLEDNLEEIIGQE
jgi:hypothetical protein